MAKNIILAVVAAAVLAGGIVYYRSRTAPLPPSPDAGVPAYPGAKEHSGDSFEKRLNPRDRARLVKAVVTETDDPPEKVIAFYKEALKGHFQVIERKSMGRPGAVFKAEIDGKQKLIAITPPEEDSANNKTQILIGNVEDLKNTGLPVPR
jgi:hypothetical protein